MFKQQYLRIGKPAPALKLKLLNGEDWSLEAQRGRVVIIQFSFKGCGPCEEMYPDLREMVASYRDDLTVLSIMADREKQDTVEASESGKITWDICWDGDRGPIATRWGVKGHPTIYVADKYGRMAGYGLRGEQLKKKVADLINVK